MQKFLQQPTKNAIPEAKVSPQWFFSVVSFPVYSQQRQDIYLSSSY